MNPLLLTYIVVLSVGAMVFLYTVMKIKSDQMQNDIEAILRANEIEEDETPLK